MRENRPLARSTLLLEYLFSFLLFFFIFSDFVQLLQESCLSISILHTATQHSIFCTNTNRKYCLIIKHFFFHFSQPLPVKKSFTTLCQPLTIRMNVASVGESTLLLLDVCFRSKTNVHIIIWMFFSVPNVNANNRVIDFLFHNNKNPDHIRMLNFLQHKSYQSLLYVCR